MHARLRPVVKAYDVRGRVPDQLDPAIARALGEAFADEVGISEGRGRAVVGRDVRASSPEVAGAVADGIRARGGDVVEIGLASTDMLYCASGVLDVPGVMVTASHNPAADNGPPVEGRRLKVVVDAGNGMAGHTVPAVLGRLDLEVIGLYLELDGTFPNHEANPLDHSTLVDLQAAVREHGADLGLAFDGDADRCFVVYEHGDVVAPSTITALVAARHLLQEPGATILHNVICSRAVPEIVSERGGVPVRTPVGHSLIKAEMARTGAVFGGEHSGHFYFREFYLADSGMLAALHVLAALAETETTVSALMEEYSRYSASGEINSRVDDTDAVLERLSRQYADHHQDRLDGLTVTTDDWWFNVRASNTEPLLRLNVEGADDATMERVRDEVLAVVRA